QGELPFIPKEENFHSSESFALRRIQEKQQRRDEEDALIGLAFVSTGNDKGQKVKNLERKKEIVQVARPQIMKREKVAESESYRKTSFKARIAASFTIFVVAGGYFFMNDQSD